VTGSTAGIPSVALRVGPGCPPVPEILAPSEDLRFPRIQVQQQVPRFSKPALRPRMQAPERGDLRELFVRPLLEVVAGRHAAGSLEQGVTGSANGTGHGAVYCTLRGSSRPSTKFCVAADTASAVFSSVAKLRAGVTATWASGRRRHVPVVRNYSGRLGLA